MDDRIKQRAKQQASELVQGVRESAQRNRAGRDDDMQLRGFRAAARITLQHLDERIDGLKKQLESPGLSKGDQAVLSQLDQLRSEFEADCDRYWQGADVDDWRPAKPLAKVLRKESEEP